jgi:hypothetical protein
MEIPENPLVKEARSLGFEGACGEGYRCELPDVADDMADMLEYIERAYAKLLYAYYTKNNDIRGYYRDDEEDKARYKAAVKKYAEEHVLDDIQKIRSRFMEQYI